MVMCIIGGYPIPISEALYQVNYGDVCGGVLFDKSWVLTAAHCGIHTFVRVGSKYRLRGIKIAINRHRLHPSYGKIHQFSCDLQLLRLHRPAMIKNVIGFSKSDGIKSINVSGWGYLKEKTEYSDTLNRVKLNIVPKESCQSYTASRYYHSLTEEMFCAGGNGSDACQGDSGGAAVSAGGVVGVSSFGHGCGRAPGVYINVTSAGILEWIRNFTGLPLELN